MMGIFKRVALCLSLVLIFTACVASEEPGTANQDKLQAVATYSVIYDIVQNIGGERVDIHSLVSIGNDPHEYDPLPQDVEKTADADLVFYNGINLETGNSWFERLIESTNKSEDQLFALSDGIDVKYLTSLGIEGSEDPHAWLDIRNVIRYAENARDAFIEHDPDHAEYYENNAELYIQELESLHDEAVERFNEIPREHRIIVTSEGAFKYFIDAYDFDEGYIWEINAEHEGTSEQMTDLIELIEDRNIQVLFIETSKDSRSMEMVSNETNIPIGGTLFTDSLASPGELGDTYIDMMRRNIDTIVEQIQAHY